MKRALLYIRVSTSRQDLEGYSIPMQKSRLVSYCQAKGWVVVGIYIDPGHSGATLERPGLESLVNAVNDGKGDVVLVYKLDRLSRSQRDVLYLLEDVFEPSDVAFVSMQESFDTSTPYGKAMLAILSAFGQMERSVISERTMMGRAGRAEEGLWHGGGTAPLGYDYLDGDLVVNKEEARQVRMVYEFYAAGLSVAEISRRMEGYRTKHGDWSYTSTIGNVLDNPLYAGFIHFDGVLAKGQHEAIVSASLNKKVKKIRERPDRSVDSAYLLTGLIYCADCGARYFPNKRPNGKVVYSCHSRAKKNKKMVRDPHCKSPHIPVEKLDAMVEAQVLRLADNPSLVDEIIKKGAAGHGGSDSAGDSMEIQRIDRELGRLMDSLQHDQLASVEEISNRIATLHSERMRLLPNTLEGNKNKYLDIADVKALLHEVKLGWVNFSLIGRRTVIVQLIDGIHISDGGIVVAWSFVSG